jgi:lipopolysaccharide/colanic/teichoic acid biosynthesis glycosyltransferase
MSVVGPRPHMLKHTTDYNDQINNFMVRHSCQTRDNWSLHKLLGSRRNQYQIWNGRVVSWHWIQQWSLDLKILKYVFNRYRYPKGDEKLLIKNRTYERST